MLIVIAVSIPRNYRSTTNFSINYGHDGHHDNWRRGTAWGQPLLANRPRSSIAIRQMQCVMNYSDQLLPSADASRRISLVELAMTVWTMPMMKRCLFVHKLSYSRTRQGQLYSSRSTAHDATSHEMSAADALTSTSPIVTIVHEHIWYFDDDFTIASRIEALPSQKCSFSVLHMMKSSAL